MEKVINVTKLWKTLKTNNTMDKGFQQTGYGKENLRKKKNNFDKNDSARYFENLFRQN